jgi:hypothetical protein
MTLYFPFATKKKEINGRENTEEEIRQNKNQ